MKKKVGIDIIDIILIIIINFHFDSIIKSYQINNDNTGKTEWLPTEIAPALMVKKGKKPYIAVIVKHCCTSETSTPCVYRVIAATLNSFRFLFRAAVE